MTLRIGDTNPSAARHSISGRRSAEADSEIRLIGDLAGLRIGEALAKGVALLDAGELAALEWIASRGLLPGVDPSEQAEFARFVASQREDFRSMRREVLCELIRRRLSQSPGDAAPWLQDLVEIEPYSVHAHAAASKPQASIGVPLFMSLVAGSGLAHRAA